MSVSTELICPACSERLELESTAPDSVILCAGCGVQFRPGTDWPATRTSRRAIASFILGLVSIGGLCLTAVPALFLGLLALRDIRHPRHAEILSGRRLAIAGASLGGFFCLAMFAMPALLLIAQHREREMNALVQSERTHIDNEAWEEAAAESRRIIEIEPDDEMNWLRAAPLHALAGEQQYRQFCDEMLSKFGETENPSVAGRTAKSCLLLPPTIEHLQAAAPLAELAATQDPDHADILWFDVTQALARYRRGDFAGAIESCKKCQAGDPSDGEWRRAALAYIIEAGAHYRLEASAHAAEALQRGRAIINSHPQLGPSWHDQLIVKILLAEIEELGASPSRDRVAD